MSDSDSIGDDADVDKQQYGDDHYDYYEFKMFGIVSNVLDSELRQEVHDVRCPKRYGCTKNFLETRPIWLCVIARCFNATAGLRYALRVGLNIVR